MPLPGWPAGSCEISRGWTQSPCPPGLEGGSPLSEPVPCGSGVASPGTSFQAEGQGVSPVGGVTDPDRKKGQEGDAQRAGERGLVLLGAKAQSRASPVWSRHGT